MFIPLRYFGPMLDNLLGFFCVYVSRSGRDQRPAESEGERPQSSSTASQVTSAGGEQLACHRCAAVSIEAWKLLQPVLIVLECHSSHCYQLLRLGRDQQPLDRVEELLD